MQKIIQALNGSKNLISSIDFRENFNAVLDKRIGDLKKFFNEKKLIHHTTSENKKSRSGYIEISKIFRNYGFITQDFIEPYSSEEESDIEDEKINEPSVREVNEKILDYRTIITVKKNSNIPKNTRPGVIIMNLEEWVSIPILKRFIEEIPIFLEERVLPKISDIRIFKYKNINFGLVLFLDIHQTKKIYSFFNHPLKLSNNPAKNSKGEKIEVLYAFDLLDMENSEWYGVILRNIPEKCSHENLKNFVGNYSKHINYLLPSTKIKNSYCSIVVFDSLEEAEKICRCINKKEMGKNRFIKAHLHPRTCLMRRNPENSIFNNYYRFDNGEYYKKYNENNVGNINNLNSNTKYTPIYRILTNFFDSKLNNLQSGVTNQSLSFNSNNTEFNNKTNEDLNNQRLQEKENSLNKKRLNCSIIKDNPIFLTNNNTFKKSTDFLNFCFDEEEKNKNKQTMDINTSYLTKLIMKPSGTSTNKNDEVKHNKHSDIAPTSTVNLFIGDIEENNNVKDIKENKNVNFKKGISSKNITANVKRFEIRQNKNVIEKEITEGRIFNEQNSFEKEKEKENTLINYKKSFELFNNNQDEYKNNNISEDKIQEKIILISNNEEKVIKTKENKKEPKQSGKRLEIVPIGINVISELSNNQPTVHITTNLDNTPTTNINKNESIISNLSGILKEMVKSDKEKTLRNQNIETTDFYLNANSDKNQEKIMDNNNTQNKTDNLTMKNTNDSMEENDEEIIDIKYPSYDPDFFKYDFHEKSYFDKPKIYRTHSKLNKDERSSHSHSKSIYDRSRDREREKDKDKDKIYPYSKFNEKSSKKYSNNAEEINDQKNTYIDSCFNYYNVNSKLSTSSSSINNYQSNTYINNQMKNSNTINKNFNQNTTSLNKTRFSNFSTADKKNNSNDNYSHKDPKISNPKNLQINSNNLNEISNTENNLNNFNSNFTQINNHVKNNYSNNNNFVNNNQQQQQILNNNTNHNQFQSQNLNSTIFSNKPNISTQQSHNVYLPNKISTSQQQIPFNPIIQNNSTIINNFINLIPSLPTELAKDKNVNQNSNNNLNKTQYPNSHSGQPFNNISFKSGVNSGNISNINVVYPTNSNIINNLNVNQNLVVNQKNYSSIANITHNVLLPNIKMDDKISDNTYLTQNELNGNNIDISNFIRKNNTNILVPQSENKNEIILPPSDDFIPPLPPENPPEPDIIKFDELELSSFLDKDYFYNKNEKLENIVEDRVKDERPFINHMISSNHMEKTEPGQILNYDSEDNSLPNLNSKKPSKRIDVKNAPINFKKYNFSRSSSSSSRSYRKKDYINKKRDREKTRKYSRERERDKDKDKRRKKYRSRSKEKCTNNISNSINLEKISQGSSSKRDNRDYKDYMSKNATSKKYSDGNRKYYKQENRSSSSSSFQSGEEGRYYKRFLERRINTKKEKK